jgi:ribosomal-protein-serine acetyltransferase
VLGHPLGDGAVLAPLEPWHAEQFAAAVAHASEHLAPCLPWAQTVIDVDSARQLLQRLADAHASDVRHSYAIWVDSAIVGGALFPMFDTRNGICELGVWLAPQVQGRGLITRAARYLVDWAIRVRGMSRVEWHAEPRNWRSQAVARRLGMTYEGVRRSSRVVAGVRQDMTVWSVLADEWPPVPSTADAARSRPAALLDAG